jgi:hypothetical protein
MAIRHRQTTLTNTKMSNQPLSNTSAARDRIEGKISTANTAALSVGAGGAMNFQNMTDIMEFAKLMSISQVAVPKHLRENPGACLAIVIQASEWQMSPYAVANKSYSVNDRMAYEAQLVSAVILRRAPIKSRFRYDYTGEGDARRCTVSVTTTDDEVVTHTSPPFGLIQPKNSPLWKTDSDQQLGYHTVRAMCRRHFPDVLLGVYTMDELQDAPQERQATGRVVTETAARIENPYREEQFADLPDPVAKEPEPQADEPEPEPQPTGEAPPESPVEVSDETERKALVGEIKAALKSTECGTFALFAPKCREAGLLAPGVQLAAAPIESLREILDNVADIAAGQYVPLA